MSSKITLLIVIVSIAMIGYWIVVTPNPESKRKARIERINDGSPMQTQVAQSGFPNDPFFVYNTGSQTDFSQGHQFFGTQDKVGVNAPVMNAYSNEIADFMFIGGRKADRVQFLAGLGIVPDPNYKWMVKISKFGIVNGVTRVAVISHLGTDSPVNGGTMLDVKKIVCEIWQLDLIGGQPTLIERGIEFHNGVSTYAESPPPSYSTPPPAEMFFGDGPLEEIPGPFDPVPR